MKKIILFAILFGNLSILSAQDKDKVKGSKNVKKETKVIEPLPNVEVEDEITLNLVKGNKFSLEIEADDNLHEFIKVETFNDKIRLFTTKRITSFKKLNITLTYTDKLASITARHNAVVSTYSELETENLTLSSYDYAELKLNLRTVEFNLFASDKSKTELNVTATKTNIQAKGNAAVETLINSENTTVSVLEKSDAKIEGNTSNAEFILSGKGKIIGKDFICKNVKVNAIENTDLNIYASESFGLTCSGDAKIILYGDPAITISEFKNSVSLIKKEK